MPDTHLMSIAYHEAGHAVALFDQGLDLTDCRICKVVESGVMKHRGAVTYPEFDPNGAEASELRKRAVVALAGWEAQDLHEPGLNRELFENSIACDVSQACRFIARMSASNEDQQAIYNQCADDARALVKRNWCRLARLARELYERQHLTAADVALILENRPG